MSFFVCLGSRGSIIGSLTKESAKVCWASGLVALVCPGVVLAILPSDCNFFVLSNQAAGREMWAGTCAVCYTLQDRKLLIDPAGSPENGIRLEVHFSPSIHQCILGCRASVHGSSRIIHARRNYIPSRHRRQYSFVTELCGGRKNEERDVGMSCWCGWINACEQLRVCGGDTSTPESLPVRGQLGQHPECRADLRGCVAFGVCMQSLSG